MFRPNQPGLLGPGPYAVRAPVIVNGFPNNLRPIYSTNGYPRVPCNNSTFTNGNTSLLGIPQQQQIAIIHQQQQQQQQHRLTFINPLQQNRIFIPQSISNNKKIDAIKLCVDSNRRNINNSQLQQQQQQQLQQQQQQQQHRVNNQSLQNNNINNNSNNSRNKQLIIIQPTNDDENINKSLKRTISEEVSSSSSSSMSTNHIKKQRVGTPTKDESSYDESIIIPVECNLIAKTLNKTQFKLDAYYCKYCSLILNDETSIKQHLLTYSHTNNKNKSE